MAVGGCAARCGERCRARAGPRTRRPGPVRPQLRQRRPPRGADHASPTRRRPAPVRFADVALLARPLRASTSSPRTSIRSPPSDGAGRPLTIDRTDPYGWTVAGHDGTVSRDLHPVRRPRRRHLLPDRRHPRPPEHARDPDVGERLRRPAGAACASSRRIPRWKIATQLPPTASPTPSAAPEPAVSDGQPDRAQRPHGARVAGRRRRRARTIRIALHHPGTDAEADVFAEQAEAGGRAARSPSSATCRDYDFGTYTFLADYLP